MAVESVPEAIDHEAPHQGPLLRFTTGSLAGIEFAVDGPEVVLGRSPECHVRLDAGVELLVSGRHARLVERDGWWWVEDLQSTNGTFVNGERVNIDRRIDPDDEVQLGPPDAEGSCSFAFVVLRGRRTTVLLEMLPEGSTGMGVTNVVARGGAPGGAGQQRRIECPWCGWSGGVAGAASREAPSAPDPCPSCGIPPPGFTGKQDERWLAPWGVGSGVELDRLVRSWMGSTPLAGRWGSDAVSQAGGVPALVFDVPGGSLLTRLRVRVARAIVSWMSSAVRRDLASRRAANASRLRLAAEAFVRANPSLLEAARRRVDPLTDPASSAGVFFEVLSDRLDEGCPWPATDSPEARDLLAALDESAVLRREMWVMRAAFDGPG